MIIINNSVKVVMLKHFLAVLTKSFHGKQFEYRTDEKAEVPADSMILWKSRGFDPSPQGTAVVKFEGNGREWTYPAYFWQE